MDFLDKERVRTFDYTDYNSDRSDTMEERINGRFYIKFGTRTATTVVGVLYKDNNPGDEQVKKYTLLVGISRQHPCDVRIDKEQGIELAHVAALTDPVMKIDLYDDIDFYKFKDIARAYCSTLPVEFIKTKQEIINLYGEEKYKQFLH